MACFGDVVDRYGLAFAANMVADGFHFEPCEDDDIAPEVHTNSTNSTEQQRALTRILGATNQVHRLWNVPDYRKDDGRLHIPYAIKDTDHFNAETRNTITTALAYIEDATGVLKFEPHDGEREYIYFNHESHYSNICAANLGKQTGRQTNIYLGWCRYEQHRGSIVHEILHSLGFWHEHSRPDRDDHVQIMWNHIVSGAENNFNKGTYVDVLGTEYDFNSIMHYPHNGFSVEYNSKSTIRPLTALNKWETMGQRVRLSPHDITEIRKLYQCASGPRSEGLDIDSLCSEDCPCWEHALGNCNSDVECIDNLVCRDAPDSSIFTVEYKDQLELYTAGTGSFSCNTHCHANCCGYANSIILCPETCDSAPPASEIVQMPLRMCVRDDDSTISTAATVTTSTTTSSTTTTTTPSTTTTATTTTSTTVGSTSSPENAWWFDSSIDKCVGLCQGDPPCGGFTSSETLYPTVEACCSGELEYMSFEDCHTIPGEETAGPTASPSGQPSSGPTQPPTSSPEASTTTTTTTTATAATTTSTSGSAVFVGSGVFYMDWDISKCVRDCIGQQPCRSKRKSNWEAGHATVELCCATASYMKFSDCSYVPEMTPTSGGGGSALRTAAPVETTAAPVDTSWYPGGSMCFNDGKRPSWQQNKYTNQSTCCNTHFSWAFDDCMGIKPEPTPNPTRKPTRKPTSKPTRKPTSNPTRKPISNPTRKPTSNPTRKPTNNPTRKPTNNPTSGPTASPSGQPSSPPTQTVVTTISPSNPLSDPPSVASVTTTSLTQTPTHQPSSGPTQTPTSSPEASTTTTTTTATAARITSTSSPTHQPSSGPTQTPTSSPEASTTTTTTTTATAATTTSTSSSAASDSWYPGGSTCLNDGKRPSWQQNKYAKRSTCCNTHFSWAFNDCAGVEPEPTRKWFVNWGKGKCVMDCKESEGGSCGGSPGGSWIPTHNSAQVCCAAHMSYMKLGDCKYGR